MVYTAILAAWHHGVNRGYLRNKAYRKLIPEIDLKRLGNAALLLALAECLDYTQTGAIQSIEPAILNGGAVLTLTASRTPSVELQQLQSMTKWFRKNLVCSLTVVVKEGK